MVDVEQKSMATCVLGFPKKGMIRKLCLVLSNTNCTKNVFATWGLHYFKNSSRCFCHIDMIESNRYACKSKTTKMIHSCKLTNRHGKSRMILERWEFSWAMFSFRERKSPGSVDQKPKLKDDLFGKISSNNSQLGLSVLTLED